MISPIQFGKVYKLQAPAFTDSPEHIRSFISNDIKNAAYLQLLAHSQAQNVFRGDGLDFPKYTRLGDYVVLSTKNGPDNDEFSKNLFKKLKVRSGGSGSVVGIGKVMLNVENLGNQYQGHQYQLDTESCPLARWDDAAIDGTTFISNLYNEVEKNVSHDVVAVYDLAKGTLYNPIGQKYKTPNLQALHTFVLPKKAKMAHAMPLAKALLTLKANATRIEDFFKTP